MKIERNVKYITIAIYSFVVIASSIAFYLIASNYGVFKGTVQGFVKSMQPIIIGTSMAYLVNFVMVAVEKYLLKPVLPEKTKLKVLRPVSLIITYTLIAVFLYFFVSIIFPQIIASVIKVVNDITANFDNITAWVIKFVEGINIRQEYLDLVVDYWNEFLNNLMGFLTGLLPVLGEIVAVVLSSVWNIVLGVIVSIYILSDKERFKALSRKMTFGLFSVPRANRIIELTRRADHIFGRFLGGKMLDSAIIALINYGLMIFFKMPYPVLVSFIVGLTNIIPFFGPFIGMVPSFFIILTASPVKAFWFLVQILLIQQFDGNFLGPKILGDSLGISAFWILFSLLVAGKFLGFIGLVIGVPLFVFIYSVVKDNVERRLKDKGLPVETASYVVDK